MRTRGKRIVAWALYYGRERYVYRVVRADDLSADARGRVKKPLRWVPLVAAPGLARRRGR